MRRPNSTPRERTVGYRMEAPLGVSREPERLENRAALAQDLLRDQLSHANHLVAVIGVGHDVAVLAKDVEHRETVRRKCANPTARFLLVQRGLAREALLAERQGRAPHPFEIVAND